MQNISSISLIFFNDAVTYEEGPGQDGGRAYAEEHGEHHAEGGDQREHRHQQEEDLRPELVGLGEVGHEVAHDAGGDDAAQLSSAENGGEKGTTRRCARGLEYVWSRT